MYRRIVLICVVVLAAGLLAAGCGDDESSASLTKAEYIKQGDAICKAGNEKYQREFTEYLQGLDPKAPLTEKKLEAATEAIVMPGLRTEAEELEELGAPSGQEDKAEEIVEAFEKAIEEGEGNPAPFISSGGGPVWNEAEQLAADFGFQVCIQNGTPG
jgi:hypothetical protein